MTSSIKTSFLKAAVIAATALSLTGLAGAETGRKPFAIGFRYNSAASAEANYDAFRRKAQRECMTPGPRPLELARREQDCIAQIMDRFVVQLGRSEIAALHAARTGRTPALVRDYASRG